MKSVKMCLSVLFIITMLASPAFAVTLTFDGVTDLSKYGTDNGVNFDGWDLATKLGDTKLLAMNFDEGDVFAFFEFAPSAVEIKGFSFEYSLATGGEATVQGFGVDGKALGLYSLSIGKDIDFIIPDTWTQALLKRVTFSLQTGALKVDNVSYTPTPLPGAAVLLFSGLLGLVGLRRRELV